MIVGGRDQFGAPTTRAVRVAVADDRRMIAEAFAALVGTLPGFSVTAIATGATDVGTIATIESGVRARAIGACPNA